MLHPFPHCACTLSEPVRGEKQSAQRARGDIGVKKPLGEERSEYSLSCALFMLHTLTVEFSKKGYGPV